MRLVVPGVGGAVRRRHGDHDRDPHEPAPDLEGVRLPVGHADLHLFRRDH